MSTMKRPLRSMLLFCAQLPAIAGGEDSHMNSDVKYLVANALPGHETKARSFVGDYFELYSLPIRSRYSQVIWHTMEAVPLPSAIRDRFNGSTAMAVTGYEVDVVRRSPSGEVSVPCTESYNHHYTAMILSSEAEILGQGEDMGHGPSILVGAKPSKSRRGMSAFKHGIAPLAQAFNEHNGNEHRQSYHGFPTGFVQPIHKPDRFIFTPMQINTRNPDGSGLPGGPLPRSSQAPPNATYSGLLECPCTTRIRKVPSEGGRPGTIDGRVYHADCKEEPLSSLLSDHNPTCEVATYMGGIECCQNGTLLLDADQDVPPEEDEVFFKWRFYFQDYNPAQKSTIHVEWALNGCDSGGPSGNPMNCRHIEYDVPQAPPGTAPEDAVHVVRSSWQVKDMLHSCNPSTDSYCADPARATAGIFLVMAGGHCHSPACIGIELINADSGEVLCTIHPIFGKSEHAKDEQSYAWLPPCQWGDSREGLRSPPLLQLDTNLTSVKRANSTHGHPGVMAIWQMRAVYAEDGLPDGSLEVADVHI
eukprot:TRINITY_DN9276_c0_g1_i1.p1 TRINITY_DN9276_c0_g1~~TRINITY_DN9276_c0_g1_i1.p1  ORF type:complete len:531 (-),score=73.17 TRINITY_DN9276_c0_g1_i1:23-1615(-)